MKAIHELTKCLITVATLTTLVACADSGRDYVLVHGAWMGAWVWDDVAEPLETDGHRVTVVELPSHGSDTALAADADLADYVARVEEAVSAAETPVRLVGHSMAGMVIAQVAENRPDDIEQLVFVAAYLPRDGESLLDLAFQDADAITGQHLVFNEDGTVDVAADGIADVFCADCSAEALGRLAGELRAEPGHPLEEPVTLSDDNFGRVPRAYIKTLQDRAVSPALQTQMLAATPVDRVIEFDTSHTPMLAAPDELVAELGATLDATDE